MKASFKKMRGFAFRKHEHKEKRDARLPTPQDELLQASQKLNVADYALRLTSLVTYLSRDMLDMKNCYDSLLSAAAATVNSAYEFSEALKELGSCLLEKTALDDDEKSGGVMLMLGKAQFELQKLLDRYRIHVMQTITTPSESLLRELETVEEMKLQCDKKRDLYQFMMTAPREKGSCKNSKIVSFTSEQLQAAQEDYQNEATYFVFRLKSLKQGQSRSLLTQAARHHAAQLNFFKEGAKSLEVVEPHVKIVAEQQHIDYQFIGPDDDTEEEVDGHSSNNVGEESFDYGQSGRGQDAILSRKSLEEENLDKVQADHLYLNREHRDVSMSAPLFADKKVEFSDRLSQMQPASTMKHHTYVLPTPLDGRNSSLTGLYNTVPASRVETNGDLSTNSRHSSPLQPNMLGKDSRDHELPKPAKLPKASSVLKENINSGPIRFPTCFGLNASDVKKIKRQAFSGPLTSQAPSYQSVISGSMFSAIPNGVLKPQSSEVPKLSPASPPISSPKINELHELPRPPGAFAKSSKPLGLIGYSGPLMYRNHLHSASSKLAPVSSHTASPLPTPPGAMVRSFSIPSSSQRTPNISVSELLERPLNGRISTDISSPPLTPISFTTSQSASTNQDSGNQATKPKGYSIVLDNVVFGGN